MNLRISLELNLSLELSVLTVHHRVLRREREPCIELCTYVIAVITSFNDFCSQLGDKSLAQQIMDYEIADNRHRSLREIMRFI